AESVRPLADHLVPHGRHAHRRRPRHDHHHQCGKQRHSMRRNGRRRALVALFVAPVLCGVLVAGLAAGAWVLLGNPMSAGAVWMQVARSGAAADTGGPNQPFFVLLLGTGARSDDPSQSPDDPGLADAIHVLGVNPSMHAATLLDIPRDTEGPDGSKLNSYIV